MQPAVPRILLLAACLAAAGVPGTAPAHDVRPAYLQLDERPGERFDVVWKQPQVGDTTLALAPRLPETCAVAAAGQESTGAALITRLRVHCAGGIDGGTIAVDGLASTLTDVLLRVSWQDGRTYTAMLRPDVPAVTVGSAGVALGGYLRLGVEHLLTGLDHVLFVLALLLLVRGGWPLFAAITAFTAAHSVTLASAVLVQVPLPQPPVEAAIALSIVFLARELLVPRDPLLRRFPWLIAFVFGLLHGLGFAGALREIGLPEDALWLALLLFNAGVEVGQLLVVGAALLLAWLAARAGLAAGSARVAAAVRAPAALGIGGLAMFWTLERTLGRWLTG
jgi:hydrogenase/urease accessory protein HupE